MLLIAVFTAAVGAANWAGGGAGPHPMPAQAPIPSAPMPRTNPVPMPPMTDSRSVHMDVTQPKLAPNVRRTQAFLVPMRDYNLGDYYGFGGPQCNYALYSLANTASVLQDAFVNPMYEYQCPSLQAANAMSALQARDDLNQYNQTLTPWHKFVDTNANDTSGLPDKATPYNP
jgi:hypothetical protein